MIRTYTKMHVSTEIKNQVRSIESEISKRKESASVLRRKKERSENRLEDMTKDFGLREHLFCGRFGGDRRGVAKARILKGYISGWFYGDGHFTKNKVNQLINASITSATEQHILQLWNMLFIQLLEGCQDI